MGLISIILYKNLHILVYNFATLLALVSLDNKE
jgi:hypothetical protein